MVLDYRLLASMHDFAGEGVDSVLARVRESGVTGVTVAAAYHTARDVFPHNPAGPIIYSEGGTVYFDPNLELFRETQLRPIQAQVTEGTQLMPEVVERGRATGVPVGAWVVALHNTRLGSAHPECAQETAMGDRLLHGLCPANPSVRAYTAALIEDIATRGFDHLLLESVSFMPFEHGYHHERALLELDDRTRFLLGLCFCPHCLRAGEVGGVDVARLRNWVSREIGRVLRRGDVLSHETTDRNWAWSACDGELGRFLEVRIESVTRLATTAADSCVRAGVEEVAFVDPSGAMLGYATGNPDSSDRAVDIGWRQGIAVERVGSVMDVATTAYFSSPDRLATELDGYLEVLPGTSTPHVILRPMPPDIRSAEELLPKLDAVASRGVKTTSFYHYGLMRLESIDWIKSSLARITQRKD